MIKKDISDLAVFLAGDQTELAEVLHPDKDHLDLPYSLAWASIEPGEKSLSHRLLKSKELYYFLEGEGEIYIDQVQIPVKSNQIVLVPAGATQWVENTGKVKLVFLCIVSPPWKEEEEEVLV